MCFLWDIGYLDSQARERNESWNSILQFRLHCNRTHRPEEWLTPTKIGTIRPGRLKSAGRDLLIVRLLDDCFIQIKNIKVKMTFLVEAARKQIKSTFLSGHCKSGDEKKQFGLKIIAGQTALK